MARTGRTRTRSYLVSQGTRKGTWIIPLDETVLTSNGETCTDSHGRPVEDSGFSVSLTDRSLFKGFSGTNQGPGANKLVYENYPMGYQRNWIAGHLPTSAPPDAGLGATILSRTNPSRPVIVPFTLVQDLVDIPKMLKDVGRLARTPRRLLSGREAANQYLGAKFGWLPLIDDAKKLINLGEYIQKRKGELDRLYSGQGLKRRIRLGHGHASNHGGLETFNSDLGMSPLLTGRVSVDTDEIVWGTARWKPTNVPPGYNPSDADKFRTAKQLVSGLTTEGVIKGAWDVLPWTWMVDWFGNIGDWLTQSSSTVPAAPVSCCIMRTKTTVHQHSITAAPKWVVDGGGVGIFTTKSRSLASGTLSASLPTLDANRLSILSALFVQRFKR
nr:MAG: putative maturation protein [Leviviridae sp.]